MTDIKKERENRSLLATQKQRKASNPDKSVWVEASAGTGKTKVLSDRVLRLLLKGVPPAKILCLTYTKAAAVEMSTRIAGRLSRWAVAKEEKLQEEISALLGQDVLSLKDGDKLLATARKLFAVLLDTPGGMKIQTIHSFCQEILKRFPLEAKISPYFEVMDDRAAAEALEEVKAHLLRQIELNPNSKSSQSLAFITQNVSEFTFPKIMNNLAANRNKISRLLHKYKNVDELLAHTAEKLGINPTDSKDSVIADYAEKLDKAELKALMNALFAGKTTDNKNANVFADILEKGLTAENYDAFQNVFLTSGKIRAKLATKDVLKIYPEAEEKMLFLAESVIELNNKLAAVGLFETTKAVLYLAEDLIGGYNAYKRLHSKMDYEDLIVLTRELLEDKSVADWVLFKLDGGIDNVLIDEAQDTSPDQWAIIRAVTEDFFDGASSSNQTRTIFAVGDRKQSIYSFQGADPKEFDNMRRYFAEKLAPTNSFEEVNLDVSFRSTAAILDTVNQVFSLPQAKQGVVPIEQDMTHVPSRIGDGGKVEIWPLVEAEEDENPDVYLPPIERKVASSTSSRLAKMIALKIKEMVANKEILVSQDRPVRFADFMILVQRRNSFVEELVRECKNADVNIAGVDKIKLLEQIAIQDLVAVAKFLLLPADDLTLATILKSPLFGLDDDDLFKLCYKRGQASLWSKLGDNPAYRETYSELQTLLNMADYVRPFELYAYILNKMQGRKKFVSRLGEEAIDGIDEFVNLTLNFEQEHIPSLQNFVNWIAQDEVEIKREQEQSDADAVRIMTVHGSKGLQAPIVILPDTVRVKSIKNEAGLLLDDDVMYYPFSAQNYEENCKRLKQEEKELSLEEYRRLLYVALTRAEDRLYICGYTKSKEPNEESWYALCQQSFAKIGTEQNDGVVAYNVAQEFHKENEEKKEKAVVRTPDFAWIHTIPEAESLLAKPLTPSKLDEEEDDEAFASPLGENGQSKYRRGTIIHKLLQFLPEIKNADTALVIDEFLQKNAPDLSLREHNRVIEEVSALLKNPDFAAVFGENSKAEVPVMGQVKDRIISGQIDRLVVEKDRVMIIDFKTNRPAAKTIADIPPAYVKQLAAYQELVAKIYPKQKIETYILWTDTANLMKVS